MATFDLPPMGEPREEPDAQHHTIAKEATIRARLVEIVLLACDAAATAPHGVDIHTQVAFAVNRIAEAMPDLPDSAVLSAELVALVRAGIEARMVVL